jgi:hypothetical protein
MHTLQYSTLQNSYVFGVQMVHHQGVQLYKRIAKQYHNLKCKQLWWGQQCMMYRGEFAAYTVTGEAYSLECAPVIA